MTRVTTVLQERAVSIFNFIVEMETADVSETVETTYQTTKWHDLEDYSERSDSSGNLKVKIFVRFRKQRSRDQCSSGLLCTFA
jgi:hypothetical protein